MVSYYVCGAFVYTIYVSNMYVLGYNIQRYRTVVWTLNRN